MKTRRNLLLSTYSRRQTKHTALLFFLLPFFLITLNGCEWFSPSDDDGEDSSTSANQEIYNTFKEWYLWNDEIPEIDPDTFLTQEALLDAIMYKELDQWSYTTSYKTLMSLLNSGEYEGFGGGFIVDANNDIKVTHVYQDSPLGKAGVERGWTLNQINSTSSDDIDGINELLSDADTINTIFTDRDGAQHSIVLIRGTVEMNTILYSDIITLSNHKIGYLVFDSFLSTSNKELKSAFAYFTRQEITDLIVDLRYNGGGVVTVANYMSGLIGGTKLNGKTIFTMEHNQQKTSENVTYSFSVSDSSPQMSSVYFITTSQTASASELVINSLSPYLDVTLVGSATHGKPVGMYVFHVEEYDLAIVPICFKNVNSAGYGDYFDGLSVQISADDDLTHDWGDQNETMLNSTLQKIVSGTIAQEKAAALTQQTLAQPFKYKGYHQIIQAY